MGARAVECRTEASALPNSGTTILGVPTRCHTCGSLLSWHLLTIPCESGRVSLWQHLPTQNGARMGGGAPDPALTQPLPPPSIPGRSRRRKAASGTRPRSWSAWGRGGGTGTSRSPYPTLVSVGQEAAACKVVCGVGGASADSRLRGRWSGPTVQLTTSCQRSNVRQTLGSGSSHPRWRSCRLCPRLGDSRRPPC